MLGPHFPSAQMVPWLAALRAGQVAAAPAEGVYGYCADPFNPAAIKALIALKQRDPAKGFIILVSNPYQLASVATLSYPHDAAVHTAISQAIRTYFHFTPGAGEAPTTLILPAAANLPELLTGTNTTAGYPTVAVRAPSAPYMLEYLQAFGGPLVSTSLNISGQPPAVEAAQIPEGIPALTLPVPLSGTPSRIFSPITNAWLR